MLLGRLYWHALIHHVEILAKILYALRVLCGIINAVEVSVRVGEQNRLFLKRFSSMLPLVM